ncbi:hypothetical protein O3G_MSEX012505 [Manduca sexta]|uniref:Glucose-methanol-choline oxidoreductase N-terminal domain-containing protein n=1 Tax=Manduca sexta TaxID=7130 RepID=A0A921ZPY9_MANSE|nr:hypothetical protein O3G_MSEX012505 [Manduca sexta]
MEALETTITNTCPPAFSGVTGSFFVKTVTALVAAHCGITDDYSWPKDDSQQILNNEVSSFDFIVVGAGTAGSVLASRLTTLSPFGSVLLVEPGDDPGVDSEIPAFFIFNQDTSMDWNYKTFPNGNSCLGLKNNSCIWSKGKAMGGSSSINAMLYIRGHPNDYDEWVKQGNPKWKYNDLKKYFELIENKFKLNEYKYPENPWYNIIRKAWEELGYTNNENDDEAKIGTRITKLLIVNGKRLNTGKVYLNDSTNLRVMKNTRVQKVILNPVTKTATGVQIRHANGHVVNISADKEVILSAGSIATPQILMLSGIGPKDHLVDKEIKCLANLPVGENLQDHMLLPILLTTNLNTITTPETISLFVLQYMLTRSGPFSNLGITDFMGFINTNHSANNPNIQFHHIYFPKKDEVMLKTYFERVGYENEIVKNIVKLNENSSLLGIYPTLLHPKSRGSILLADADPQSPPIINANYLDHPDDVEDLLKAIDFIRELVKTKTFRNLGIRIATIDIPGCSDFSKETKQFWTCYIRHMATTIYHPVGTAKMGPMSDKTSVVNQDLRVHGVEQLRVVDASVMPLITGGNTIAPTLAIAEKAADMIKKYYELKDEL